jgi:hypothetical protein
MDIRDANPGKEIVLTGPSLGGGAGSGAWRENLNG